MPVLGDELNGQRAGLGWSCAVWLLSYVMLFRFVLHHLGCLKMCRCLSSLCRMLQRCRELCLTLGVTGICSYAGCEV